MSLETKPPLDNEERLKKERLNQLQQQIQANLAAAQRLVAFR